jgi:hypothetical protein
LISLYSFGQEKGFFFIEGSSDLKIESTKHVDENNGSISQETVTKDLNFELNLTGGYFVVDGLSVGIEAFAEDFTDTYINSYSSSYSQM